MNRFLRRLLGSFNEQDAQRNLERIRKNLPPIFTVPADLANPMMDYMLERTYMEEVSDRDDFRVVPYDRHSRIAWLRINRLPVSPARIDDYDLLSRWQSVLSSLHAWHEKLLFLLQRQGGETRLYVGIQGDIQRDLATECGSSFCSSMPGVDLKYLNPKEQSGQDELMRMLQQISNSPCGGAITGIPSFRKDTQYGVLQTLDKLAFGLRDVDDIEANYSFLVIAEPISDDDITDIIARFQRIGSDIHSEVTQHVTHSQGSSYTEGTATSMGGGLSQSSGIGAIVNTLLSVSPGDALSLLGSLASGGSLGLLGVQNGFFANFGRSYNSSHSVNYSESVAKDYLNKFAQYTELLTDKHCERLRAGRSLGFWNTGVYVLAENNRDVKLVNGILRSVYSGDKSYIEPIRVHTFHSQTAIDTIRNFNLVPLASVALGSKGDEEWHILGRTYQYVSTPVNSEELSLFTSLPRKDVPGLRFVKNAVRFANNPGVSNAETSIKLGNIVDTGVQQNNQYLIDINALVRHSLVVGSTGCGKTTTCKTIINSVLKRNVPVLIIEPAKDEWVRWALAQNKHLPDKKKIKVFEPGVTNFEGTLLSNLRLNPFQPAACGNAPIDMQTRCEQITALINASLPTSDILPVIMDETIYTYLKEKVEDFEEDSMEQLTQYPLLEGALPIAKRILAGRGYEPRVTDGLTAALETRFRYLTRGKRGKILNNLTSTSYDTLFGQSCVINLSKIPNAKDKALIMSILLLSLYEYRMSAYAHFPDYRNRAQANLLQHLTVIEEAHNVLAKPAPTAEGTGNPQQVVADLFSNMLSEIRSLGEGFMIIDQVPTKLIPDVIKNTNYKICHRMTSIDDCAVMAQALALRKDQEGIIPMLEQGNVVISSDLDDAASWIKVNKPLINL